MKSRLSPRQSSLRKRVMMLGILILLGLLLIGTILIIVGNLGFIPWSDRLNTIFVGAILPALACIVALVQGLHSSSHSQPDHYQMLPAFATLSTQEPPHTQDRKEQAVLTKTTKKIIDLREAPSSEQMYGREKEKRTLVEWITADRCRTIALLGTGGIGKSTLAAASSHDIQDSFDVIFWRSLLNLPPIEIMLKECIEFISFSLQPPPTHLDEQIRQLLTYFQGCRCLLVLDNFEAVLSGLKPHLGTEVTLLVCCSHHSD
jgi:NB-ARC domain